jgi:hypothetical protein
MSGSCDCNDSKKFYYFISENKGYASGLGALIDSWTPLVTFWESKKEHIIGVVFRSAGGTLRCCLVFVCIASKDTREA